MADIVLFHHAQGLRSDMTAWADSLREAGHEVWTPDLFEGRTFERLADGGAHRDEIGIPELIRRATEAVEQLPVELVYAGFSMGAASAQYFAANRPGARGAVLMCGVAPVETLGVDAWPGDVPVQIHYMAEDGVAGEIEPVERFVRASGALIEVHTYPGDGHLFADPDGPDYDRAAAELMLERELEFLRRL